MIIQSVKFNSDLSFEDIEKIMEDRAPEYRALPGLIQKYYGYDEETKGCTGVFVWESREAVAAFRDSDLARTTAASYEATEAPRIEIFDLVMTLYPVETAAAVSHA